MHCACSVLDLSLPGASSFGWLAAVALAVCAAGDTSHAGEIAWGPESRGLAIGIRLERDVVRPGRDISSELWARNASATPLVVRDVYNRATWEVTSEGRDRRVDRREWVDSGRVVIPAGRTVLLERHLSCLAGCFDLFEAGTYLVRCRFRNEQRGGTDWYGEASSATLELRVDPEAPTDYGTVTPMRAKLLRVFADYAVTLPFDFYLGQVGIVRRGDEQLGRVRVAYAGRYPEVIALDPGEISGGHSLLAIAPLLHASLREGDSVEFPGRDSRWFLSVDDPSARQLVSTWRAELALGSTRVKVGERWTGSLRMINTDRSPQNLFTLAGWTINLRAAAGPVPNPIERHSSRSYTNGQLWQHLVRVEPGGAVDFSPLAPAEPLDAALVFERRHDDGACALGWNLPPGRYRVSARYTLALTDVLEPGITSVATGVIESNTVEVEVTGER